jgi:hypothetical protein
LRQREEAGYTVIKTDLYPKTQDTTRLNCLDGVPEDDYDFKRCELQEVGSGERTG